MSWLHQYWDMPIWLVPLFFLGIIHFFVIVPGAAFVNYVERKLGADLQARIGPNRTPLKGFFQPLADLLKLLQKEDAKFEDWRHLVWVAVLFVFFYCSVAVLPLGSEVLIVNTQLSPFIIIFSIWSVSFSFTFMGLRGGFVESSLNAFRFSSQGMAGLFPAFIALLSAGITAGGFDWSSLVNNANFLNPFHYLQCVIFFVSGMTALNLPPFDSTNLFAGYSGLWLSLLRLFRFYSLFMWSIFTVAVFFGGWALPLGINVWLDDGGYILLRVFLEFTWISLKASVLLFIVFWISRVNPRVRVDHLTELGWKVLSPASLFCLLGSAVFLVLFY